MDASILPANMSVYGLRVSEDWLQRFLGTHAAQARPHRAWAILEGAGAQGEALGAAGARVPAVDGGGGTEVVASPLPWIVG